MVVAVVALLMAVWAAWAVRRPSGGAAHTASPAPAAFELPAEAEDPLSEPRFQLDHVSTHRYVLRNVGEGDAYAVRVETGELSVHEGSLKFTRFPPGHTEEYLMIQPLQGPEHEVVVTWHEQRDGTDDPHSTPLPLEAHTVPTEDEFGT